MLVDVVVEIAWVVVGTNIINFCNRLSMLHVHVKHVVSFTKFCWLRKFPDLRQLSTKSSHTIVYISVVNTLHVCTRGKIIGLSICRCQHKNYQIWNFRQFSELSQWLNYQKHAYLGLELNGSSRESYDCCFCVCHAYQPHSQLILSMCSIVGQLAHRVCALVLLCSSTYCVK